MEKKTKLTISGSAKKSIKNIEIAKSQGKNSVVIEKQTGKFSSRGGSFRSSNKKPRTALNFNRGTQLKSPFNPKSSTKTIFFPNSFIISNVMTSSKDITPIFHPPFVLMIKSKLYPSIFL